MGISRPNVSAALLFVDGSVSRGVSLLAVLREGFHTVDEGDAVVGMRPVDVVS